MPLGDQVPLLDQVDDLGLSGDEEELGFGEAAEEGDLCWGSGTFLRTQRMFLLASTSTLLFSFWNSSRATTRN